MWDTVESNQFLLFFVAIRWFVGFVGFMTLLVGGIGLANIMYVVVEERTKGNRRQDGAGRQEAIRADGFHLRDPAADSNRRRFWICDCLRLFLRSFPRLARTSRKPSAHRLFRSVDKLAVIGILGTNRAGGSLFPGATSGKHEPCAGAEAVTESRVMMQSLMFVRLF